MMTRVLSSVINTDMDTHKHGHTRHTDTHRHGHTQTWTHTDMDTHVTQTHIDMVTHRHGHTHHTDTHRHGHTQTWTHRHAFSVDPETTVAPFSLISML